MLRCCSACCSLKGVFWTEIVVSLVSIILFWRLFSKTTVLLIRRSIYTQRGVVWTRPNNKKEWYVACAARLWQELEPSSKLFPSESFWLVGLLLLLLASFGRSLSYIWVGSEWQALSPCSFFGRLVLLSFFALFCCCCCWWWWWSRRAVSPWALFWRSFFPFSFFFWFVCKLSVISAYLIDRFYCFVLNDENENDRSRYRKSQQAS